MSSQDVKGSSGEEWTGDRRLIGLRRYWAKKRRNKSNKWAHIKGGKLKSALKATEPKKSKSFQESKFEESKDSPFEDDDDDPDVSEDTEETEGDSQDEEEGEVESSAEKMENLSQGGERKKLLQLMSEQFNSADISGEALPITPKRGSTLPRLTRKRKSEVLEGGDKTPETSLLPGQTSQGTPKSGNSITSALKKVRKESTDTPTPSTSGSPTLTRKKRSELEKSDKGSDDKDLSEDTASVSEASEVESRAEELSGIDKNAPIVQTRKKGRGRHLSESNENDSGTESPGVVIKGRGKTHSTSDEETSVEVRKTPGSLGRGRGRGKLSTEGNASTPSPVGRGRGRGRPSNKEDSIEGKGKGSGNVSSPVSKGRGRSKTDTDSSQNTSMSSPVGSTQGRGRLRTLSGNQTPGQTASTSSTPPSSGRGRGRKPLSLGVSNQSESPGTGIVKKPRGRPPLNPNREVSGLQQKQSLAQVQSDASPPDSKRKSRPPISQDFYVDSPLVTKRGKQMTIPEIIKKQESGLVSKVANLIKVKKEEPETKVEEIDMEELPDLDVDLAIELSVKAEGSSKSESSFTTEVSGFSESKKKKKKKHFKGLKYSFGNKKKKISAGSMSKVRKMHGISRLDASVETDSVASEDIDIESIDSSSQDVPSERLGQEADEDVLDEGTSDAPDDGDTENSVRTPDDEDSLDDFTQEDPTVDLVDETSTHSIVENASKVDESIDVSENNLAKHEVDPEEIASKENDSEENLPEVGSLQHSAVEVKMVGESISLDTAAVEDPAELEMELKIDNVAVGSDVDEQIDPGTETSEFNVSLTVAGQSKIYSEIESKDLKETPCEDDMQLRLEESREISDEEEEIDPGTESVGEVTLDTTAAAEIKPDSENVVAEEEKAKEASIAVQEQSEDHASQKVAEVDVYEFDDSLEDATKSHCHYSERKIEEQKSLQPSLGEVDLPHETEVEKIVESVDDSEDVGEKESEKIMESVDHSENIDENEPKEIMESIDQSKDVDENEMEKIVEPIGDSKVVSECETHKESESAEDNEVVAPLVSSVSEIVEGTSDMPEMTSIPKKTDISEQTPVEYEKISEPATEEAALKEPLPHNSDHNLRGRRRHSMSKRKLEDLGVEGQNSDSSDSLGEIRTAVIEGVRKSKRLSRNSSPHPLAIAAPRSPEGAGPGSSKPQGSQSSYVAAPSLTNVLCKCRVKENPVAIGITGDVYCKAVDSFDGRMIGCCNIVTNHRYLRVSGKIPFILICDIHRQRLRRHNCCPCCGLFCTQGVFYECSWDKNGLRHYYHKLCALMLGKNSLCPHCGTDQPPTEVHLELKMNRKPVIYLKQQQERKEVTARMTWSKKEIAPAQPEILPEGEPSLELNGAVISAHKLPLGLDRQKLQDAIRSINAGKTFNIKPSAKGVYWACKQGDLEKLLHVLVNGVSPNVRVKEYGNQTGLHVAATYCVLAAIHVLVLAGASLDMMDMQLMSPLMVAIIKGHNEIAQYLIQAGASLMAKNQEGMTSLHLAAKCGNYVACQYILDSGRLNRHSINMQDEGGWTPLVWASENRFINVVKFLLDRGGNPQLCDVEQNTALHWAAFSGSTQICSMLLDRGCSLRSMNAHGDTPLHIAARQNHTDAVVLFLARGARLDILNSKQQTPLDCAIPESDVYLQLNLNHKLLNVMKQNSIRIEKILSSDIAAGKEAVPIPCVNGMDDDSLPKDYLYIAENCEASNVNIDRTITSLKWCECEDGCNADSCECGQLNFQCWYDPDGRLLPDFNYADPPMIFECNRACRCNKLSCNNRVVQHGISAHMQLFKTDGKGWGVRALKTIQKGSYVCEYVGEIITDLEADQREDDSYLFDLDNRDSETFCIDARSYGNIARFINHLCEPNLTPVKIFIDHQDLTFPRIALFANRDIEADEELGFDYGEKFWIIKYKHFTCTCGAEKCKYSNKTIYTTLENYNQRTMQTAKS